MPRRLPTKIDGLVLLEPDVPGARRGTHPNPPRPRAPRPFRRFEDHWPRRVEAMVAAAESVLGS